MKKFLFSFLSIFLLLSIDSFASLSHRSEAEILSVNSQAIDLQYQKFVKKASYDQTGAELISSEGDKFSVSDWKLKYTNGIYSQFEASTWANFRNVNSETQTSSAVNSGLESIGLGVKYLFFSKIKFKNALGLRFKKAMYTNMHYDNANPPPSDKVALGDDGLEMGVDYLITYFDKFFKYDFKLGYNKPANLSSELIFNAGAVYSFTYTFLSAGIGGIHSLNNDPYTDTPSLKPVISSGTSRLFNSINREKNFLYAGAEYAVGDFILGLKGESIFSGKSTDKGETISLNIRWEKNEIAQTSNGEVSHAGSENYFAEGFVEKVSKSGNMVKINIGSEKGLALGVHVDVFNINDDSRSHPMATGTVIKIGPTWSIVTINKRYKELPIQTAFLVKAF